MTYDARDIAFDEFAPVFRENFGNHGLYSRLIAWFKPRYIRIVKFLCYLVVAGVLLSILNVQAAWVFYILCAPFVPMIAFAWLLAILHMRVGWGYKRVAKKLGISPARVIALANLYKLV